MLAHISHIFLSTNPRFSGTISATSKAALLDAPNNDCAAESNSRYAFRLFPRKVPKWLLLAFSLGLVMCMTGCVTENAQLHTDIQHNNLAQLESQSNSNGVCISCDFDDIWARSDLICSAEFTGTSDPFLVEPALGGEPKSFLDYYFELREVFAGDSFEVDNKNARITVRQRRDSSLFANGDTFMERGNTYLLCLYQEVGGFNYNTDGDHHYLACGKGGIFKAATNDRFESTGFVISKEDLANRDTAKLGTLSPRSRIDSAFDELEERFANGEYSESYYEKRREILNLELNTFSRVLT